MFRIFAKISIIFVLFGCSVDKNSDFCKKIQSVHRDEIKSVVYVHLIFPDLLFAEIENCPDLSLKNVTTEKLSNEDGIFYILNRSEAGFLVPYDANIYYDSEKMEPHVYLLNKNKELREKKYVEQSPPAAPLESVQ
jgi:hypothetical protein